MKVKTTDLIGPALDWAVATIEGYVCQFDDEVSGPWLVPQEGFLHDEKPLSEFSPSTNWSKGGPIIERENLSVSYWGDKSRFGQHSMPEQWWEARHPTHRTQSRRTVGFGPTPLIATIRCYCCAKLGDVIDIPEELLQCQQQRS